ncbi:MAG TPA: glycosyl hydrolase [Thermoanaerobaculia bacterium]|nr:glycosyl hydrolase [Thermoanaerobaculia bacterium]
MAPSNAWRRVHGPRTADRRGSVETVRGHFTAGRVARGAAAGMLLFMLTLPPALRGADAAGAASVEGQPARPTGSPLEKLLGKAVKWREIGPYRGGRSAAVAGVPGDRATYYFGATGGGVWKSTDAGRSWHSVSDDLQGVPAPAPVRDPALPIRLPAPGRDPALSIKSPAEGAPADPPGGFGGSIGAVAVAASDPNVLYAGGGEETVRGNVSEGDGMWRSTDAGKTWKRAGLEDSRHITAIRIHPKNPDLVYAAALGHLFGPNPMRGVYRSHDGGAHWQRVLSAGDQVGAADLAMDPVNPRVLYASLWRVRRTPYSLESGGPGSGLWKSTDGGDNWTELTLSPGLPRGNLGIIGIAVSPSRPDNLYAIVEAEDGGVFRSRDGGKSWTRTNQDRALRQRAWYYSRIYADPADEESVYVLNVAFHRSRDGGKSFATITTPHGDNHDLWIAPEDPRRMIEANDGGVNVSEDGGATWTPQDNQPTAQIYRVSTDSHFPYRIYGAQQDNSALRISSRGEGAGIGRRDWQETAGGESGYIVADPRNPEIVYGGSYGGFILRLDHLTGQARDINAWPDNPMGWPAADLAYRFQWNFPIFFSPHPPHALYAAANVLFKSTDEGQSWTAISPDLTRNDKTKQGPSGGPITKDNTSIEYYDTIFTAAESPVRAGVLWAGSDDGLVHVSHDGGRTWSDVTPKDVPAWSQINSLDAHPFEPGGAYFAATLYKSDDTRPLLYKTTDYGRHWSRIDRGIAATDFTRVVRADPARRGLLFAGTEHGIYCSFDDGEHWRALRLGLPVVPVADLAFKDGELIAATQGRGFWALDLAVLRDLAAQPAVAAALERQRAAEASRLSQGAQRSRRAAGGAPPPPPSPLPVSAGQETPAGKLRLLTPVQAYRLSGAGDAPAPPGQGQNPPAGVVVYYYLAQGAGEATGASQGAASPAAGDQPTSKECRDRRRAEPRPAGRPTREAQERTDGQEVKLEFMAADGTVIRSFSSKPAASAKEGAGSGGGAEDTEQREQREREQKRRERERVPAEAGFNRFVWDLSYERARSFPSMVLWSGQPVAPLVVPGQYRVRLTAGKESATAPFSVLADPRSAATPADREAQLRFLLGIRDTLDQAHAAIRRARDARAQLDELRRRLAAQEAQGPIDRAPLGAAAMAAPVKEPAAAMAAAPVKEPAAGAASLPQRPSQSRIADAGKELDAKLAAVEEALYQTRNRSSQDPLNFPIRLTDKLNAVAASAAIGDSRPTAQAVAVRDALVAAIDAELAKLGEIWSRDLSAFNELARQDGVTAVTLPLASPQIR